MIRVGLASSQVFHGRAGAPASRDHASVCCDAIWLLGWSENPGSSTGTLVSVSFMQECIYKKQSSNTVPALWDQLRRTHCGFGGQSVLMVHQPR